MPPEPRPEVTAVLPAVHGAVDHSELQRLGIDPNEVLDFSSNTNPYGPSPAVRTAFVSVPLDRYPDRESLALRAALSEFVGVSAERILVGNGASELIALTALAFVRHRSKVLIIGPTYSEYARTVELMGGNVVYWRARAENDFAPIPGAILRGLADISPELVYLCTPNNPTGTIFPTAALDRVARLHPKTLFVVDEAYLPFAPQHGSALDLGTDNVLVLRSMTKDFALAGVRLGYAVGPEPIVEALRRTQVPWSVSALAQVAGIAALSDLSHRNQSLELLGQAKAILTDKLVQLGLRLVPSEVPFFLVRVGDGAAFRKALLARRILVRNCASFGLPEYVRISTRRPEENERLLAAIREVL
jgi:histidinol-phosphate aminotransferase